MLAIFSLLIAVHFRLWGPGRGPAAKLGCWPGLAPAGDSLSLASPRESKQREGEPGVRSPALRFGVPCAARNRREAQKLGPSALRHLSLLIRRLLRCSALPHGMGRNIRTFGCGQALIWQFKDPHPNPPIKPGAGYLPKGRGSNSWNPAVCGARLSSPRRHASASSAGSGGSRGAHV